MDAISTRKSAGASAAAAFSSVALNDPFLSLPGIPMTVGMRLLPESAQEPPEKSSLLIRDEVEAVPGISGGWRRGIAGSCGRPGALSHWQQSKL
jgi:hypothetical protein